MASTTTTHGRTRAERTAAYQRQFVKYTFFKVAAAWRGLPADERAAMKQEVADVLETFAERMLLRVYSTVGTRGDCDLMLWTVSDRLEDFQELTSRLFGSQHGRLPGDAVLVPGDDPPLAVRRQARPRGPGRHAACGSSPAMRSTCSSTRS